MSSNNYTGRLTYNATSFSLTVGGQEKPARTITLGLDEAKRVAVGPELATITRVQRLRNNGTMTSDFSLAELRHLADIRERLTEGKAPEPAAPPPPVVKAESTVQRAAAHSEERTMLAVERVAANHAPVSADGIGDRAERLAVALQILKEPIYVVSYDIPVRLNKHCPNPSRMLRQIAARKTKSQWAVPQRSMDSPAMQELLAQWASAPKEVIPPGPGMLFTEVVEVTVDITRYRDDEIEPLQRDVIRQSDRELREMHDSLIKSIIKADETYAEAERTWAQREADRQTAREALRQAYLRHEEERSPVSALVIEEAKKALLAVGEPVTEKEQHAAKMARDGAIRGALANARDAFAETIKGAELFDTTDALADLKQAVRTGIRAEAKAFNARMIAEGRKPVKTV